MKSHAVFLLLVLGGLFSPVFVFAEEEVEEVHAFIGPEFHTDTGSYVVMGLDEGDILLGKDAYEMRPIASLTKLMTAMVALDEGYEFTGNVAYDPARHYAYRNYLGLVEGDVVENRDLWVSMLAGSMNVPAKMIVDSLGVSDQEFVQKMNMKARALGMQAVFVDVHGLDPGNVSNAVSVGKMIREAYGYEKIVQALAIREYVFNETVSYDEKYQHTFKHTNMMFRRDGYHVPVLMSKTGYLHEAGTCLGLVSELGGEEVVVVTLGETEWWRRHREADRLAQWWDNLSLAQKARSDVFLVKYPNDPYVFEVTADGLRWVPDEKTFFERGYRWDMINEIQFGDRVRMGADFWM